MEIYPRDLKDCSFGFARPNLPKTGKPFLSPDHSPSGRGEFGPRNKDLGSVKDGRSTRGLLGPQHCAGWSELQFFWTDPVMLHL